MTPKLILCAAALSCLAEYQCHKIVRAGKIFGISPQAKDGTLDLYVEVPGTDTQQIVTIDAAWQQKHQPTPGGYLVAYADGYTSFSPAAPFESGYTLVPKPSTFLDRLKAESDELEQRLVKLGKFLDIPDSERKPESTPSAEEMTLLRSQRQLQQGLLDILKERLRLHA